MKIPIIYEDKNIIVVDKPAGLLVHPSTSSGQVPSTSSGQVPTTSSGQVPTTSSGQVPSTSSGQVPTLIDYFPSAKLVHRLDRDTSGLLLLAKNEKTENWLKNQFENRKITKKYIALVHGKLKDKTGIITKTISRSKKRGRIQTIAPIGKKREAITEYKVLKEFDNYSLLKVMPKTGRTHQIRVHLASIGHPVVGDKQYKFKRQPCPKELKRQFLHANYLRFKMPDESIKEFYSNLPEDLKKVLENL